MKISFYLVIWIIIQFIFVQIDRSYITHCIPLDIVKYDFEITCVVVLCIYWIINHRAPCQIIFLYERKLRRVKIMNRKETDVETNERTILSCLFNTLIIAYFIISTILIAWTLYNAQVMNCWWGQIDWIGLIIFVLFSYRIIIQHIDNLDSKRSANSTLFVEKLNPIDETYIRDLIDFVKWHKPRKIYLQLNLVFSIFSILLGCTIGMAAIYLYLAHDENRAIGIACIFYLYGSLTTYYGIKDLITTTNSLRTKLMTDNLYDIENEN